MHSTLVLHSTLVCIQHCLYINTVCIQQCLCINTVYVFNTVYASILVKHQYILVKQLYWLSIERCHYSVPVLGRAIAQFNKACHHVSTEAPDSRAGQRGLTSSQCDDGRCRCQHGCQGRRDILFRHVQGHLAPLH